MAEIWDEAQLIADGFERAHVELDWYDGPRVGVADIDGRPHYFKGHHYERYHEDDEYEVWPASTEALEWEREQSAIFVKWSERYRAGEVGPETHPGHGGNARHNELDALLAPHRQAPDNARRMKREMRFVARDPDEVESVNYWFRWRPTT
ncbi:hypothetical protein ACGFJT_39665 [Actinomadura geliboluensis]|uniref:hypothetical protein n=1 Tax=Actinomadura geliboluensis TaxID=882440 RepID=UPI0036811A57